jgi:hypothetical protein
MPPGTPEATGTPEPFSQAEGGTEGIGYSLVIGSDPPMWRVWSGDESFFISPDSAAEAALLTQFMLAAHNYSIETANMQSAEHSRNEATGSVVRGIAEVVIGGVVAIASCGGVPFTFWAAGGTGWVCAGSIGLVGVGIWETGAASSESGYQAEQYAEAAANAQAHAQEAQSAFDTLRIHADE